MHSERPIEVYSQECLCHLSSYRLLAALSAAEIRMSKGKTNEDRGSRMRRIGLGMARSVNPR